MTDKTHELPESPVKRFIPLVKETPPANNGTIDLRFFDNFTARNTKDIGLVQQQTRKVLTNGFEYVSSVLGTDFPFLTRTRSINFTSGDYARCRAQGQAMNLPIEFIREFANHPAQKEIIVNQSLIAHEIMHEITDAEDLPMFLEMIYVIEHGVVFRISQIKSFLAEGELTPAHVQGLKKIAGYLKYQSPEEMLDALPDLPLVALKDEFKKQMGNYCNQEFGNSS